MKVSVEKYLTSLGIYALKRIRHLIYGVVNLSDERSHTTPAAWNAPTAEPRTKQRLKVRVDHVDVVLMPAEFASALAERPN